MDTSAGASDAMQRQLTGGDSDGTMDVDDPPPSSSVCSEVVSPLQLPPTSSSSLASIRVVSKTVHWEVPLYKHRDCEAMMMTVDGCLAQQQTAFDSDPFQFLGQMWRLSFLSHSEYSHGVYLVLLSATRAPPTIQVGCEFRLHCLLRPTYSLRASADYFFGGAGRPTIHGFDHFIGPRLAAYVNNEGCVLMSAVLTSSPEDIIL
jgi:hypothetical protein